MNKLFLVGVVLILIIGLVSAAYIYCEPNFCLKIADDKQTIEGVQFANPLLNYLRPELKQQVLANELNNPLLRAMKKETVFYEVED